MALLWFLLFGFVVGLVARALMPGNQGMGILMTALLGMGGSLVGGFLTSVITGNEPLSVHSTGLIGSILGAMIVLAVAGVLRRKA